MKNLPYRILSKEPVLLGAAISVSADGLALLAGASTTTQAILHGITIGWVAWGVRVLSTPEAKAKERVATASTAARHKALADVASLQPPPKPARARGGAKRAPATRQ